MDPLALVSGVAGLILFVKELKKVSSDLYQTVKKKPQFLRSITEDLDALLSILKELEQTHESLQEGLTQEQDVLSRVLASCKRTLVEINERLVILQRMFSRRLVSRLISYNKFDEEVKEIVRLRDELAASKATLSLALHLRTIKCMPQSPSNEDLVSLGTELSLLKALVQRSRISQDHIQGSVIQQYIDASSIIVSRDQTKTGNKRSSTTEVVNSPTTDMATICHTSEEDSENVKSFGSFDDWLSSFSPPRDSSREPYQPDQQDSTSSSLRSPKMVRRFLSKDSRVQVTVRNLTSQPSSVNPSLPSLEVIELGATDFMYEGIQLLQDKGHKDVCGFRIGDHLLGPLLPCSSPFPLYVTDTHSSFAPEWLEIDENHVLEQFYDTALRSDSCLKPMRMYSDATRLTVLDEYDCASIDISLNRTLRVPEDGTIYNLPALFGPFPLLKVDSLKNKLPETMARKSGLLIPMFAREALSMGFQIGSLKSRKNFIKESSFAIKLLTGSVNAISGGLEEGCDRNIQSEKRQDYIVAPRQERVDGFFSMAGVNIVRQFTAMPTFSGYTAESQLKGGDDFGGVQLVVAPRFAGRGEFRTGPSDRELLDRHRQKSSPSDLGLQPGNVMFVSGVELMKRFHTTLRIKKDVDALCTGRDFFIPDHVVYSWEHLSPLDRRKIPHPNTERPAMVHELFATLVEEAGSSESLVLEPIFRMTISIESRHSTEFCAARGEMYIGEDPASLGFQPDYRFDKQAISLTWRVSPFMSLQQFFQLVRAEFRSNNIALFRGHEQLEERDYQALHYILEDGAVISCQAYTSIRNPTYVPILGYPSVPREKVPRASPWEMGLAPGGEIYQDICVDPKPEWWNWERSRFVNIQILNAVAFKSFTGFEALPPPLSFREYVSARIPFFHLIPQSDLVGSKALAKLKSVGQKDLESGLNLGSQLEGATPTVCIICEQNLANTILRPCNHIFCSTCIKATMTFRSKVRCSACMKMSSHRITFAAPMEAPKEREKTKKIETPAASRFDETVEAFEGRLLEERSTALIGDLQTALTTGDKNDAARIAQTEQPISLARRPDGSYRTPLQVAAEEGRLEIVDFLLRVGRGGALDFSDEVSYALELAAAAGHIEVVKRLSTSQLISADVDNGRPLEAAVENGHKEVVSCLLQVGHNLSRIKAINSAIYCAASKGYDDIVRLLIAGGSDPDHTSADSQFYTKGSDCPPARIAARHGFENVLAVLFHHGADMESDCDGRCDSPLHEAASNGHSSAVRYLISIGVSTDRARINDSTKTPLRMAAEGNHIGVVDLLVHTTTPVDVMYSAIEASRYNHRDVVKRLLSSYVAQLSYAQRFRNAALIKAAEYGALETVQYLLESGADVYCRTHKDTGETPLHKAARSRSPNSAAVLKLLLDYGADIRARHSPTPEEERKRASRPRISDATGETAFLKAIKSGNLAAFEFLLSVGADILDAADNGKTCLHMAAESGVVEMGERLLDLGLDRNQEMGCYPFATPLEIAVWEDHVDLMKLLLSRGAVLENGRLLELAAGKPSRWPNRRSEMALILLPHVDFAAAQRAVSDRSPKSIDVRTLLGDLVSRSFATLTSRKKESRPWNQFTPRTVCVSVLQLVSQLCPGSIDDGMLSDILEKAALGEDYPTLDAVFQALPEDICLRVSTHLSNKLGPNARSTKIALYLAQCYGGPEAWSGCQRRGELDIPDWVLGSDGFKNPRLKKDSVDMTSNMLWDGTSSISEKLKAYGVGSRT